MCWTRETGVIPAALAGLLVGMKAPGAQVIASVTFIAILMTILIQATDHQVAGAPARPARRIAQPRSSQSSHAWRTTAASAPVAPSRSRSQPASE